MLKPAPNITHADNPIKTVPKLLWTRKSPESPQMCSLFFKALISNDTDTEAPTEGAAKTFSEARLQTQRWPQSVFADIVIATNPVQHHPVPSSFGSPQGAPALLPAGAYKWSDPCLNSFGWMVFVLFSRVRKQLSQSCRQHVTGKKKVLSFVRNTVLYLLFWCFCPSHEQYGYFHLSVSYYWPFFTRADFNTEQLSKPRTNEWRLESFRAWLLFSRTDADWMKLAPSEYTFKKNVVKLQWRAGILRG